MGKAYEKELAVLGETYAWACAAAIGPLGDFVSYARGRSMLAIGSGGSATAAHLAALLHRHFAGPFARHVTPLEALLNEPNLGQTTVLLASAAGKNRDVLAALDRCVQRDVRAVAAVCTQHGSPLSKAIQRFERGYMLELEPPCGTDGFLATNSLLATCVFIARAYGVQLPARTPNKFLKPSFGTTTIGRSVAIVLHGGWGAPVATDLESKLNESAIASAQVSDFRNFGHGRHHWLARRASETFVIVIVTPETLDLAQRTRSLLPSDIPVIELRTTLQGALGTIDLLAQGFHLIAGLGRLQAFDPGRPKVPQFGRKLYHLAPSVKPDNQLPPVMRKLACRGNIGPSSEKVVTDALGLFLRHLGAAKFGGVVLDYDGTLCGRAERFGVLRSEIASECRRLLESGIIVGIATGRGRSARESLQKALPRGLWKRVIVGYYNGGEIGQLSHDEVPSRDAPTEPPLDVAKQLLEADVFLSSLASFTARRRQITVEPKQGISTDALMSYVMTSLSPIEDRGIRVLTSSHSVDVLPAGIGKLAVVEAVKLLMNSRYKVLCVGDRGAWPGNDCSLLSHELSLSVDEVSASLATCWNLSPAGITGVDATLQYLRSILVANGYARFDSARFWGRK